MYTASNCEQLPLSSRFTYVSCLLWVPSWFGDYVYLLSLAAWDVGGALGEGDEQYNLVLQVKRLCIEAAKPLTFT